LLRWPAVERETRQSSPWRQRATWRCCGGAWRRTRATASSARRTSTPSGPLAQAQHQLQDAVLLERRGRPASQIAVRARASSESRLLFPFANTSSYELWPSEDLHFSLNKNIR
ncbi:hypothetical protein BAE44_0014874, partial [Dichanthelium oligosanthes]